MRSVLNAEIVVVISFAVLCVCSGYILIASTQCKSMIHKLYICQNIPELIVLWIGLSFEGGMMEQN